MGRAVKKLNSQRGASLLLALMLFLVCAMVSAVVLGAASTNAQKVKDRQAQLQRYASVSSAAQMVRELVSRLNYEGSEYVNIYGCTGSALQLSDPPTHQTEYVYEGMGAGFLKTKGEDGVLADLLMEGAELVYRSQIDPATGKRANFTGWTKEFVVNDNTACKVKVTVSIDREYTLTFVFAAQEDEDYRMTLVCHRQPANQQEKKEEKLPCSHLETHYDDTVGKDVSENASFNGKTVTTITPISWDRGSIYKGVSRRG